MRHVSEERMYLDRSLFVPPLHRWRRWPGDPTHHLRYRVQHQPVVGCPLHTASYPLLVLLRWLFVCAPYPAARKFAFERGTSTTMPVYGATTGNCLLFSCTGCSPSCLLPLALVLATSSVRSSTGLPCCSWRSLPQGLYPTDSPPQSSPGDRP